VRLLCSALYSNFQGGHCLTHVGTEGDACRPEHRQCTRLGHNGQVGRVAGPGRVAHAGQRRRRCAQFRAKLAVEVIDEVLVSLATAVERARTYEHVQAGQRLQFQRAGQFADDGSRLRLVLREVRLPIGSAADVYE
jgi:hypothetical protein